MYYFYNFVRLKFTWGSRSSLNNKFVFYQDIFNLVTEGLSSSVIRDLYWPWIPHQPRSFYQVRDLHRFLVDLLRYLKPSGDGVYHSNGF